MQSVGGGGAASYNEANPRDFEIGRRGNSSKTDDNAIHAHLDAAKFTISRLPYMMSAKFLDHSSSPFFLTCLLLARNPHF